MEIMDKNRMNMPLGSFRSQLLVIALIVVSILELTLSLNTESEIENALDTDLMTDKRYAMMSYGFRSHNGARPAYRHSGSRQRVSSYQRPWEQLPDYKCYRKRCSTSSDCCRRYNVCDPQVKVCYDCWYGYSCESSRDCCQRYPYCHPRKKICYN
nr:uncharacterized protein LOC105342155 [Crassostrea gigas]XP_011447339.2 uncharacterized protein LOC105342155 [Crassostrea gigas]XP_034303930.1 uncharacterized protein LOC105342155 [Crassostrea gigas]